MGNLLLHYTKKEVRTGFENLMKEREEIKYQAILYCVEEGWLEVGLSENDRVIVFTELSNECKSVDELLMKLNKGYGKDAMIMECLTEGYLTLVDLPDGSYIVCEELPFTNHDLTLVLEVGDKDDKK
ncbi:hypothetical protein [Aquibacillus sediminis]|uniref:hypothetical protein n=1 Tax=Aquibacillus sediminis TaxID=2574734 RepID=UPI001109CA36|nr:hypothetical protein [Aquibacillus sediminis]